MGSESAPDAEPPPELRTHPLPQPTASAASPRPTADALDEYPRRAAATLTLAILAATAVVAVPAGVVYKRFLPRATSLLAVSYTLGLRHALDADHIAAIDNVTRRLVEAGTRPVTVGLFFSLGHSTVVVVATILVAVLTSQENRQLDAYRAVSGTAGASISASFLLLIGAVNAVSLVATARSVRRIRKQPAAGDADWSALLAQGGFFARVIGGRLFRVVDRSWKMYFVGLLFGLGLDTATEIAMLALAAIQSADGASTWLVMFLALLFTCGMVTADTVDALLMLGAYSHAAVAPITRIFYSLVVTAVSCLFALSVASLEILGIFQETYDLGGPFWDGVGAANDKAAFSFIGIALLACFIAGWTLSKLLIAHSGGCGGAHSSVDAESATGDCVAAEAGCCPKVVTHTVAVAAAADDPTGGEDLGLPEEMPATDAASTCP